MYWKRVWINTYQKTAFLWIFLTTHTDVYTHPKLNYETEKLQIFFAAGIANLQVLSCSLKNCHTQRLNITIQSFRNFCYQKEFLSCKYKTYLYIDTLVFCLYHFHTCLFFVAGEHFLEHTYFSCQKNGVSVIYANHWHWTQWRCLTPSLFYYYQHALGLAIGLAVLASAFSQKKKKNN